MRQADLQHEPQTTTHGIEIDSLPSKSGRHMPDDGVGGTLHVVEVDSLGLECSLPRCLITNRPRLLFAFAP